MKPYDVKKITSPQNPLIRELLAVKESPRRQAFLIEGPHLVTEALAGGTSIDAVLMTASFLTRLSEEKEKFFSALSRAAGKRLFEAPEALLKRLAGTKTPQGILARCALGPVALRDLKVKKPALIAIGDGINEPGNLGALIRAADAAGADACIATPGSAGLFSPRTLRASAGGIFHLPVIEADTGQIVRYLREKKILLAGADAHAEQSIYEVDLSGPLAVVFGSEAHGLSPALLAEADVLLRIPIKGKAESLNVGAAAAVVLFEAVRQRLFS